MATKLVRIHPEHDPLAAQILHTITQAMDHQIQHDAQAPDDDDPSLFLFKPTPGTDPELLCQGRTFSLVLLEHTEL